MGKRTLATGCFMVKDYNTFSRTVHPIDYKVRDNVEWKHRTRLLYVPWPDSESASWNSVNPACNVVSTSLILWLPNGAFCILQGKLHAWSVMVQNWWSTDFHDTSNLQYQWRGRNIARWILEMEPLIYMTPCRCRWDWWWVMKVEVGVDELEEYCLLCHF